MADEKEILLQKLYVGDDQQRVTEKFNALVDIIVALNNDINNSKTE